MNVFLDTNIVLDVFTLREPFYDDSAAVWGMAERREIVGLVSAVTMTSMYYIVRITRNQSHFAASEIPVMTPAKFLATHRPRR